MESPNTLQAIELNPSCSGQAHSNWPGIGHGQGCQKWGMFLDWGEMQVVRGNGGIFKNW